jgi:uncharacterized Tic20 family protein
MQATIKEERTWAMLCHLAALAGYVLPLGNIIGPLVVWLIKKDQSRLVDDQGKESLNFQISVTIYAIIAGLSILVVVGILLLPLVLLFGLILIIVAAIRANEGVAYRYPLTLRFIK